MALTLVLGGARSGKSAYAQAAAEALAARDGGRLVMVVTARADDEEMAARIARHRADRGEAWTTVEAPEDLPQALAALPSGSVAVVDCLTLWLSNLMLADRDTGAAGAALVAAVSALDRPLWLVSNEVGMGIVPENALARRFRDEVGRLHQRLAAVCDRVVLIAAGLPLVLKDQPR